MNTKYFPFARYDRQTSWHFLQTVLELLVFHLQVMNYGFQRFSAPTHPTGYAWEEKQVKCKVKIIRKNVTTIPGKQFI